MAREPKSFEDLVNEAPAAPKAGTTSLVGTLAQSSEAGKFVLSLEDGRAITLDVSDVKGHAVLGTSVGMTIVRVDVDSSKIPSMTTPETAAAFTSPTVDHLTVATLDHPITIPDVDHPFTLPRWDYTAFWWDHPGTPAYIDYISQGTGFADVGGNTIQEGIPGNQPGVPVQTPFALATPHQAPANTLAALQGAGGAGFNTWVPDVTGPWDQTMTGRYDPPHTGIMRDKIPYDDDATNIGSRFLD